ncbi:hypothetical protein ACTVZO_38740 [Streptomyces sp. IBSNAI002]|uniref:hypothetical protein n=1 Tax=Streptomyces sp. IBSNAI002 TaxID=3457500 RepID=UPI003FD3AB2C
MHQRSSEQGPLAVGLGRRDALRLGTLLAAWGMSALVPVGIDGERRCDRAHGTVTTTYRGSSPFGFDQWAAVDFDVPDGVRRISVSTSFQQSESASPPGTWPSGLDTGVFGPDGFRGWSGDDGRDCTLSAADATPGYLPGPIEAGRWCVALGPTVSHPQGMGWQVAVTLEYGTPPLPVCGAQAATRPERQAVIRLRTEVSGGRSTTAGVYLSAASDRRTGPVAACCRGADAAGPTGPEVALGRRGGAPAPTPTPLSHGLRPQCEGPGLRGQAFPERGAHDQVRG